MTGEERREQAASEESLKRAEELLERLEATRARLESSDDPEQAIEVLGELAEIAKQVEAEIARAKREAEDEAEGRAES